MSARSAESPALSPVVARLVELCDLDPRGDSAIAAAAGIKKAHLSMIRQGHRRSPSIDTFAAILRALDRPFAALD